MAADQRRETVGGLARVALAATVWGTIPLVLRAADGASAVKVFYRVAVAGIASLVWMAATRRLPELTRLPRRRLARLVAQGAILALNWLLFLTALDMTKVAVAELLGYTGPVFVAALAPVMTREPFDKRIVVPLLLALAGIGVILAPQGLSVTSGPETTGALLAFGSALTYAILMLRAKNLMRDVSATTLMTVEYITSSVLLAPVVFLLPGPSTPLAVGALLTLGLVHTAASGLLFLSGLRRVRTDHAAILMYAEPVSAVLFAALLLAEPLTLATLAGGAMVVAGGVLVARLRPAYGPEVPVAGDVEVGAETLAEPGRDPSGSRGETRDGIVG